MIVPRGATSFAMPSSCANVAPRQSAMSGVREVRAAVKARAEPSSGENLRTKIAPGPIQFANARIGHSNLAPPHGLHDSARSVISLAMPPSCVSPWRHHRLASGVGMPKRSGAQSRNHSHAGRRFRGVVQKAQRPPLPPRDAREVDCREPCVPRRRAATRGREMLRRQRGTGRARRRQQSSSKRQVSRFASPGMVQSRQSGIKHASSHTASVLRRPQPCPHVSAPLRSGVPGAAFEPRVRVARRGRHRHRQGTPTSDGQAPPARRRSSQFPSRSTAASVSGRSVRQHCMHTRDGFEPGASPTIASVRKQQQQRCRARIGRGEHGRAAVCSSCVTSMTVLVPHPRQCLSFLAAFACSSSTA
jgi:hypothetical protein